MASGFIIGVAVGMIVMDVLWARKTGTDRRVLEAIKSWWASRKTRK